MPTFEYTCKNCDLGFEEILVNSEDIKNFSEKHKCPICNKWAKRQPISVVNFSFKSSTPGNSGSHDLDYPTLDKAVGRSAENKWGKIYEKKAIRDKVRKEIGTNSVTQIGDKIVPVSPEKMAIREKAFRTLQEVSKKSSK
jgi:putative FmdB family regulatory protein